MFSTFTNVFLSSALIYVLIQQYKYIGNLLGDYQIVKRSKALPANEDKSGKNESSIKVTPYNVDEINISTYNDIYNGRLNSL